MQRLQDLTTRLTKAREHLYEALRVLGEEGNNLRHLAADRGGPLTLDETIRKEIVDIESLLRSRDDIAPEAMSRLRSFLGEDHKFILDLTRVSLWDIADDDLEALDCGEIEQY